MAGLNKMNFADAANSRTEWSDETKQCLTQLTLWLSGQADCLEMLGITGGKELSQVYRQLSQRIGEFYNGGPACLDSAVDVSTVKSNAMCQIFRR